jgi:hypothetical protein
MKIFPPDLNITETEGFSAKDLFARAPLGKGLTHFVGAVQDPLVIALDAQWGSGKTTFLKMWAGDLRNAGFPVVYFDAFEHDYFEDAFLAIAGQIIALAAEKRQTETAQAQRFVSKAKGVAKVIASSSVRLGVKAATFGMVDTVDLGDTVDKVIEAAGAEAEKIFDKHVEDILNRQKEQKDSIRQFRDALSELPSLLAAPPDAGDNDSAEAKPLIFIIDELDRCRPVFALQVLERIKHFFSVENVHFVLGVHLGQLQNSVSSAYGSNIDARLYLEKFIHLIVPLVDTPQDPNRRTPGFYVDQLAQSLDLRAPNIDTLIEELARIANAREFSLRTVERVMTTVAISLAFIGNVMNAPPILAGLCVLKVSHPDLFVKAKIGTLALEDVMDPLALRGPVPNEHEQRGLAWLMKWWRYCLGAEMTDEEMQSFAALRSGSLSRERIVSVTANRIVDRLMPGR